MVLSKFLVHNLWQKTLLLKVFGSIKKKLNAYKKHPVACPSLVGTSYCVQFPHAYVQAQGKTHALGRCI